VTLSLTSGGAEFATVLYQITGNGIVPITGTIDVTNETRPTAFVSGIPAGSGYLVTMTAASTDGLVHCTGSTNVTVVASQTAAAVVVLQCPRGGDRGGFAAITGRLDNCPVITGVSATSLQGVIGGAPITIGVTAIDADANPISYTWSDSP